MTRGHTFFCVICGRENQVGEHTARCREVQAAHKLEMISPGWRRSEASRWGRRGVAAAALWRDSIFPPLLGVPTTSISVYMSGLKLSHHTRAKDSTWQQCSTLWNLYTPWTLRDSDFLLMSFILPLLLFSASYRIHFSNGNPIHPGWNYNFYLHPADTKPIFQHSPLTAIWIYSLQWAEKVRPLDCDHKLIIQQRMQTLFGHDCDVQLQGMCLPTTVGHWTTGF